MGRKESGVPNPSVPTLYFCKGMQNFAEYTEEYDMALQATDQLVHIKDCETCQVYAQHFTHIIGWQGDEFLGCLIVDHGTYTLVQFDGFLTFIKTLAVTAYKKEKSA